jgi:hypothetical protein
MISANYSPSSGDRSKGTDNPLVASSSPARPTSEPSSELSFVAVWRS